MSLDRPSFVNSLDGCRSSATGFITLIMSTISFFSPVDQVIADKAYRLQMELKFERYTLAVLELQSCINCFVRYTKA